MLNIPSGISDTIKKLLANYLEKEIKENKLDASMTIAEFVIFLQRSQIDESTKNKIQETH